jgi:signal transduction histidine kinase
VKILNKTYLLISILIIVAIINLFLLYQGESENRVQSNAVIETADIKVAAESISALAISIANGNEEDREKLEESIQHTNNQLKILEYGGTMNGLEFTELPNSLKEEFVQVKDSWNKFSKSVIEVENTPILNPKAQDAINYILQKNSQLVLLTNDLKNEVELLDRDYNEHKQIAKELAKCSQEIGQLTLLVKIGEEDSTREELSKKTLEFDIGLRKILNVSTEDLDVESVGLTHEELTPIPRENSSTLREIDPLWESMESRFKIIDETGLVSPEFNELKTTMNEEKEEIGIHVDHLLNLWNQEIVKQNSEEQLIIQILLGADIGVFFLVLFTVRQSLSPLQKITQGMSKIKEGVYGEKLEYKSTDEVGELVNTFNIMTDTIKEKEEEAKKTDIAKDEFLAMITHELKTPLVPIQGYSDILLNEHLGKLTDKQKERISIIKSSSETLLSIISDLLDAQKLELGQLRMVKEEGDIKRTITKAVETLKPEAEGSNIEIISNPSSVMIKHDSDRIGQVMTNLIKNSIIAIQPNPGKIEVLMEDTSTNVKISIKDNGVGIPIEKQKDLFKKFYQVDATLTRERGGSGLGLAICKGIIDNHMGEITVESVPNQGSTFSFTIPKENSDDTKSPLNSA